MTKHDSQAKELLEHISLGTVEDGQWGYFIHFDGGAFERITLVESPVEDFLVVVDAGDTMKQAKVLFSKDCDSIESKLSEESWKIRNRFHFSNTFGNLFEATGAIGVNHTTYIHFWQNELSLGSFHMYRRPEWKALIEKLSTQKMMSDKDLSNFTTNIDNSGKNVLNICPGIHFEKGDSFARIKTMSIAVMAAEWRKNLNYFIELFR